MRLQTWGRNFRPQVWKKFPESFMFRLMNEEDNNLRFQFGTSNERDGRRYNPYVFTEQGVAMHKYISSNLFGLGRS